MKNCDVAVIFFLNHIQLLNKFYWFNQLKYT